MSNVTIRDIAKKLKITPSTVSRALANNPRVNIKTRELVQKTAKEMGYRPNLMASALRKGKSDTIGMIVPRINRFFFGNVISGVEEILNPAGYNLVISQTNELFESEKKAINTMLNNRVGGIIISLSAQTKRFEHLKHVTDVNIPLVQFDRVTDRIVSPKIINDNYQGAYLATKHLIESGYKRIVHFGGPLMLSVYKQRYEGYLKAMSEAGLNTNKSMLLEDTITRDQGYKAINKIIKSNIADAVFSASDFSALGALDGLREEDVKVPEEFGLVGFSNEQFSGLMNPALSTVEQYAYLMGNEVAKAMINSINKNVTDYEKIIPTRILIRESSKKSSKL